MTQIITDNNKMMMTKIIKHQQKIINMKKIFIMSIMLHHLILV